MIPTREVVVHILGVPHTVRIFNEGSGTPLLLRNGVGAATAILEEFMEELGDLTIILVDQPPVFMWLPWKTLLVASAVRKAGFEEIDVAGISYGGAEAQQITFNSIVAEKLPSLPFGLKLSLPRVRRQVLISTAPAAFPGNPVAALALMLALVVPRLHGPLSNTIHGHDVDPEILEKLSQRAGILTTLSNMLSLTAWTSIPSLPFMDRQTLVIHGRKDRLTAPRNIVFFQWLLPNKAILWWDDYGHLLAMEEPEVAEAIRTFLDLNTDFVPGELVEEAEVVEFPRAA